MRGKIAVLSVLVGVLCFGSAVLGQPWDGNGVEGDPYQIWTAADMQAIGADANYWDAHFELMADVDLSAYGGTSYNLIGGTFPDNPFNGVFDGNGHTISNFTYESTGTYYVGIFRYVDGVDAEIKNLGLLDPNVDAWNDIGSLVGMLGGGAVSRCYVEGGSVSGDTRIGGLVGFSAEAVVSDCYSTGSVSGRSFVGGLVGLSSRGVVSDCYSTGSVSGSANGAGGLVGENGYENRISDSYSTAGVAGEYEVGGLVGWNDKRGTISNCHSSGDVSGTTGVGGLVGLNDGIVGECFASGGIVGYTDVGGLAGRNRRRIAASAILSNSYATGSVSGNESVGGLLGSNGSVNVTRCYATGSVSGSTYVGGLVGEGNDVYVIGSFWDVNTSGEPNSAGGTGLTTVEMQTESTFTDAGWDFVGELVNGPNDIWAICEGVNYPKLAWQFIIGDFDGDNKVDFVDFDIFATRWLDGDGSFYCGSGGADLTNDGQVGLDDLREFSNNWLAGL